MSLPPSLEWHVWSSSSGNNCHAVHRSLSSGASVCDCTAGFYLFYIVSQAPPTRFLPITGYRNVSLPLSLEWHVWPGRRSIYNTYHPCRMVRLPQRVSWYDTKQSDGETLLMMELWRMWSTPSLSSFSGPLWLRMVTPDMVPSMRQIKLNCVLMLKWIVWNRTVYMYKMDLALNEQQWLMGHKTKPNQTKSIISLIHLLTFPTPGITVGVFIRAIHTK